jgi:hypothetical protein
VGIVLRPPTRTEEWLFNRVTRLRGERSRWIEFEEHADRGVEATWESYSPPLAASAMRRVRAAVGNTLPTPKAASCVASEKLTDPSDKEAGSRPNEPPS